MPRTWIAALLPALQAESDPAVARRVLKAAAQAHWDQLRMAEKVAPYAGNLDGLLEFLRTQWGWKIERPEPGVIVADENKSACVCPLIRKDLPVANLSILCNCSEGFAERLFGAAVGHPVRAEVTQSVLRGAATCRYRITLA